MSDSKRQPFLHRLWRTEDGTALMEFGFVLPVLAIVTLGLIEFTVAYLDYHRVSEAVRRGARVAIIAEPIVDASDLSSGDSYTCTSAEGTVTCDGGASADNPGSFVEVLDAVQALAPSVVEEELEINYAYSGLGDPATPGGTIPFVTVRLAGHEHAFLILPGWPGMPDGYTYPELAVSVIGRGADVTQ